ncbi:MAG: ABC transporter permease [Deltaproteobacteria bacterium]|nr:ABC transporter permease [Deltaproteobacteria bacterium]
MDHFKTREDKSVEVRITKIRPSKGWVSLGLKELWEYRELLYFLIWRDVKVRYKQTVLGAAWAVIQPFFTMVVFTIFFGRMAKIGSDGLPYPIFSYTGLLPWLFFAHGLNQCSNSLVGSSNLIKKVFFPRLVIPVSAVLSGVVDSVIAFSVLLVMMAWYGIWPTPAAVLLPLLLLLAFATALGTGMWLSALNVQFRAIRYVVPFFVQLWLFATPVIYPMSRVLALIEKHGLPGWLLGLNPMVGVVGGFRWALLGTETPLGSIIIASSLVALSLLTGGAFYFRRMEKTFADVV